MISLVSLRFSYQYRRVVDTSTSRLGPSRSRRDGAESRMLPVRRRREDFLERVHSWRSTRTQGQLLGHCGARMVLLAREGNGQGTHTTRQTVHQGESEHVEICWHCLDCSGYGGVTRLSGWDAGDQLLGTFVSLLGLFPSRSSNLYSCRYGSLLGNYFVNSECLL